VLDALVVQVPDGPAAWWTAAGTFFLGFAAVGVAWWSDRRAGVRVAAERAAGTVRLEEERGLAREREQLAEAHKVQVVLAELPVMLPDGEEPVDYYGSPIGTTRSLVAVVVNRGSYTITGVECRFRLSTGEDPVAPDRTEWLSGLADLPERLRAGPLFPPDFNPCQDRLASWDTGIRFVSEPMPRDQAHGAYPVARWADRHGTWWEYRQGVVSKIAAGACWEP
jgi:hypothetical protein